jgi:integrase
VTGTLRPRGPNAWELRVSAGRDPLTGKYRQVTRTFHGTKTAAKRSLAELAEEVDKGRHTGTGTATLGLLLDRWLELAAPGLSPRTVDGYRSNIDVHIKPWLGDVPVRKLCDEPARLDDFYAMLRRPHPTSPTDPTPRQALKPATVGQVHAVIRRACRQGVIWRWIPTNPASLATPGSREAPEQHPPAPADALRLIAAAGGDLGVLLRLAAATGARRGELCALRWRHVDLEGGNVRIERALVESGGQVIDKTTKTKNQRTVSLDADTLDVLRAHRAAWEARAAAIGATIGPASWLFSFAPDASEPMRPSSVTQAVRRLRDRLGLAGVRTHSLRHMHATQLLAARVPVKTVSARLGHTLVSTTLNIYAHSLDESDTEAAGIMGVLLAPPTDDEGPQRER